MGDNASIPHEHGSHGGCCVNCGYSLAGIADKPVCPECGTDPLVTSGDPNGLVGLIATDDAAAAGIMSSTLGAAGIRAVTTSGGALFMVRVRRTDFRAARDTLVATRLDPGPVDWESLGLGDIADEFVDDRGRCIQCRYDVSGLPDARRCPECGGPLCPEAARADAPLSSMDASLSPPQTRQPPHRALLIVAALLLASPLLMFGLAMIPYAAGGGAWYDWLLGAVIIGLVGVVVALLIMMAAAVRARWKR